MPQDPQTPQGMMNTGTEELFMAPWTTSDQVCAPAPAPVDAACASTQKLAHPARCHQCENTGTECFFFWTFAQRKLEIEALRGAGLVRRCAW